jgi:hypothetical protein
MKVHGLCSRWGTFSVLAACLWILSGTAHAAGSPAVAGKVPPLAAQGSAALGISPEQRLREELRQLLLDMIESGAFGQTPPEQISLSIDAPAERAGGLGLLVDSSSAAAASDGLHVLGATPGGSASRMGLRSGDVIVAVNGVSLADLGADSAGRARAAERLREQVGGLEDGAPLNFRIVRDGSESSVSGVVASAWVPALHLTVGDGIALASARDSGRNAGPAAQGCGRVNIFDVAPRQRDLHAAVLISIDGERSPFQGQSTFRLSAGRHELKVAERIDSRYLSFNDRLRNSEPDSRYKTLTIEVAPNTTYLLAARLNEDKRNVWRDGAYWDPVIWSETPESCR